MPSPRSVLIDIETKGLKHTGIHTSLGADGRLKSRAPVDDTIVEAPKLAEPVKPRLGLVSLPEKAVESSDVESPLPDDEAETVKPAKRPQKKKKESPTVS